MTESLQNISDTALWVAQYRAMETRRPDAIFRDPYAEKLAGEQGERIVSDMKVAGMAWPMIVRTAVMDEIILRCVEAGEATTVVNLAAGLDARPYRLALPAALRWYEVDLPPMIAYKTEKLSGDRPVCALERTALDLTDAAARQALFARIAGESSKVLVVTEGLLAYLSEEEVGSLAADLRAPDAFRLWLIDLASPRLLQMLTRRYGKHLDAAQAPFKFGPAAGTKFFEPFGWKEREYRSMLEESHRLKREMRLAWLWRIIGRLSPTARREEFRRMSGIVLLEKSS
jgi:methyltransferase (TIGR00027 family)